MMVMIVIIGEESDLQRTGAHHASPRHGAPQT